MRLAINIILLLIAAGLAYLLYQGIQEPIKFSAEKERRQDVIVGKLEQIRDAQEMYRGIVGEFAPDFDTLVDVLRNGKFTLVAVIGDPDDPNFTGEILYDTTFVPAFDSVQTVGIDLDDLPFVPTFKDTEPNQQFQIAADVIEYQSTDVAVVEVGTKWATFMGEYASARFNKYDQKYNPNAMLKFGDLNKPNLSGNWE